MKPLPLLFLIACILPHRPAVAWNGGDHRAMPRGALAEVAEDWGLDRPVPVRPLASFLEKLGLLRPELGDPWHLSDFLKINPAIDLEQEVPEAKGAAGLAPIEILSHYSIDPDDGRDQNLFIRDEKGRVRPRYPGQGWFGPPEGENSQAFRHIEKPPFSLRHPAATLGLPLKAIGEASERAQIYYDLALLAASLSEDYWAWRFLAGSFHYLQDLHNPYHAGQITLGLLADGLGRFFRSSGKKGLMKSLVDAVSDSHRSYERFVSDPPPSDKGEKDEAFARLRGKQTLGGDPNVMALSRQARDESNLFFGAEGNDLLWSITQDRFESAALRMRTEVRWFLDQKGREVPAAILERLEKTLHGEEGYPTSS